MVTTNVLIVFTLIFVFYCIVNKKHRKEICKFIVWFFDKRLLTIWLTVYCYFFIGMLLFIKVSSCFDLSLLKNGIIWVTCFGLSIVYRTLSLDSNKVIISDIKENLGIYSFLVITYETFELPIFFEFAFLFISIFAYIHWFKYFRFKNLAITALIIVVVVLFINLEDKQLYLINLVKNIVMTSIYLILMIPLCYFIHLYKVYEELFTEYEVTLGYKGNIEVKQAKRQVLISANINYCKLKRICDMNLNKSENTAKQIKQLFN